MDNEFNDAFFIGADGEQVFIDGSENSGIPGSLQERLIIGASKAIGAAKTAFDAVAPVVRDAAQKAAPVVRSAAEKAEPVVRSAAQKAAPVIRSAAEKAAPVVSSAVGKAAPLFRSAAEKIIGSRN